MGDAFGLCGQPFAGTPRERYLQSDTWRRTLRYRFLSLLEYIRRHIAETLAEDAMRTMGGLVTVTPGNLKTVDLRNIYEMSM